MTQDNPNQSNAVEEIPTPTPSPIGDSTIAQTSIEPPVELPKSELEESNSEVADEELESGDQVLLLGTRAQLDSAKFVFSQPVRNAGQSGTRW